VLALPGRGSSPRAAAGPSEPYRSLGTWIDLYSPSLHADAERLVAGLAARHVDTLFVETGNFRQRVDLVRPRQLAALVDAAHARGIAVVAWYLPSLTNVARDLRRARAAIGFRTDTDGRFDAFGLDIESTLVRDSDERTRRLLQLSSSLRSDAGPGYQLGAIIPSPVGMKLLPRYWPRFPYAALARIFDVFVPMAYYSYRAHGAAAVRRYVQTSVRIIRGETGDAKLPIHVIGGLADATAAPDVAAFARAAASCGAYGLSLYDYDATRPTVWPLLDRAAGSAPATVSC
jgi:hypothetical protein